MKKKKATRKPKPNTQQEVIKALLKRRLDLFELEQTEFDKVMAGAEEARRAISDARDNIQSIGDNHRDELDNIESLLEDYDVGFDDGPDWESEFDNVNY